MSKHPVPSASSLPYLVFLVPVLSTVFPTFCPQFFPGAPKTNFVGKTTLASIVTRRLNDFYAEKFPESSHSLIAALVPMDGYHLSRSQLSEMPDPDAAYARRGAEWTFDASAFVTLVRGLRQPLSPESVSVYAPSFYHTVKDPVHDDIPIPPTARVVIFEGNYLSLGRGKWKEAAELMDEMWFVEV